MYRPLIGVEAYTEKQMEMEIWSLLVLDSFS